MVEAATSVDQLVQIYLDQSRRVGTMDMSAAGAGSDAEEQEAPEHS